MIWQAPILSTCRPFPAPPSVGSRSSKTCQPYQRHGEENHTSKGAIILFNQYLRIDSNCYHPLVETMSTKWKAVHWEKYRCFNNLKRSMFGEIPLLNLNKHQWITFWDEVVTQINGSITRSICKSAAAYCNYNALNIIWMTMVLYLLMRSLHTTSSASSKIGL